MDAQLRLLAAGSPDDPTAADATAMPWRLDDTTRAVGRLGVAHARAALQEARQSPRHDEATAA